MTAKNPLPILSIFQFVFAATLACFFTARAATNEIPAAPGVLRATLTNGLQVIIVRNTIAPVVTTMVNYRVGSDEAPAGFPGMAHATEHMMFRGSPGLSADQLAAISAAFGGDDNADTQQARHAIFFHHAGGKSRSRAARRGHADARFVARRIALDKRARRD